MSKIPAPKRIPFREAIVLVDRAWRQRHGKKPMPGIHMPWCSYNSGHWTIRRGDSREVVACVDSEMVLTDRHGEQGYIQINTATLVEERT